MWLDDGRSEHSAAHSSKAEVRSDELFKDIFHNLTCLNKIGNRESPMESPGQKLCVRFGFLQYPTAALNWRTPRILSENGHTHPAHAHHILHESHALVHAECSPFQMCIYPPVRLVFNCWYYSAAFWGCQWANTNFFHIPGECGLPPVLVQSPLSPDFSPSCPRYFRISRRKVSPTSSRRASLRVI